MEEFSLKVYTVYARKTRYAERHIRVLQLKIYTRETDGQTVLYWKCTNRDGNGQFSYYDYYYNH